MKFARGLLVVSWVSASLPLAIACGSAGSSNLFSSTGGASSLGRAGTNGVAAGSSSAGADTAGMSAGGTSEGGASAGERGVAGKGSGGVEPSGGSPGAGGKGHGGAPSGGGPGAGGAGAGGASAGAGGATAGAGGSSAGSGGSTAGSGGVVGSNGGASGSGNGEGCPVNGAPTPGAPCQVTTPDSCFYSGVACSCQQSGASAFGRKWACYGTPDKCPDNAPAPGSGPCKTGAQCPYPGGDFCACVTGGNGGGNEPKFACQSDAPVCPDMKPFKDSQCTTLRSCAYADDQCFCDGDNWTCESN
ncbi:MAG TPA: hypothetical protein VGF76_18055 [Polyangiaceae bacterium]|jgi:hypothetical protein